MSVALEEMDQLEAGGGAGLEKMGGLGVKGRLIMTAAANCLIHLIKVIHLVILSWSGLV